MHVLLLFIIFALILLLHVLQASYASNQLNHDEKAWIKYNLTDTSPSEGRIFGGTLAKAGDFKFSAAIYWDTPEGRFFCTGSILSERWVLTAAHCVYGATKFTIQLGSTKLSGTDSNRATVTSTTATMHPGYDYTTLKNDIALIRTSTDIKFTEYIQPVDFIPLSDTLADVPVTALGWGLTSDSAITISNDLYYTNVSTISNSQCYTAFGYFVQGTNVCTKGSFNQGACEGDSGGPLVQRLLDGSVLQVGVFSFLSGRGCEYTDPSGYTRLYAYVDWVRTVTGL